MATEMNPGLIIDFERNNSSFEIYRFRIRPSKKSWPGIGKLPNFLLIEFTYYFFLSI